MTSMVQRWRARRDSYRPAGEPIRTLDYEVARIDEATAKAFVVEHPDAWILKFWSRVLVGNGCWLWTGSRLPRGYGRFYPAMGVGLYAHRFAWEVANGRSIPGGLQVLHSCDNPPCVRPKHLSVGTGLDNMRDMVSKGRQSRYGLAGELHPAHRLTEAQVAEIRAVWAAGGVRQRELARRYGISRGMVGHIVRGDAWKRAA